MYGTFYCYLLRCINLMIDESLSNLGNNMPFGENCKKTAELPAVYLKPYQAKDRMLSTSWLAVLDFWGQCQVLPHCLLF